MAREYSHPHRKPKLLDQVREAIRARHYSIRTEEAYAQWIRRYILFHNKRHPKDMGEQEINEFVSHLATDKNVAASTQTQALSAIVFLYRYVLKKDLGEFDGLIRARKKKNLPVVFTKEEAKAVISKHSGPQ